ncbi:hypothetical protein GQ457_12G012970 [Hibiscus cannabinus]
MEEGQSISKPPFFNGANYPYWKNRMMLFIQSTDYSIWDVVLDGPFTPMKREGDTLVPKQRHEWNDEERRRVQMNAKAMHILFCALGPDEYAKMSSCTSAKEIWDKLEVTQEGTSEVKETKIGLLNLSYENFKMEPDEDIKKMFDRFSVIVNGLKGYGEAIPEDKLVRKLIYSLPKSWDSKKTAIIEAKNLKTLKLDELMGSLLTHELMNQGKRDEEKKKEEKKEIVKHAMEIIYLLTDLNPIQVIVDAIINSGPREDATRIGSVGVVRRQAVDISPLRCVNQAIYLLTTGARESAFRNIKTIAECLADELINAAKGSSNSYAIKKKDEIERVAKANR